MTKTKDVSLKDILDANDVVIEPVNVPQWGGMVYVRSMSLPDYAEVECFIANKEKNAAFYESCRLVLLSKTLCDKTGDLLFDGNSEAIEQLKQKNAGILDKLWEKACDLNNLNASVQQLLEILGVKKND